VPPGEALLAEADLLHDGSGYAVVSGRIRAAGKIAAEAEITYRVVPFPNETLRAQMLETARRIAVPEAPTGPGVHGNEIPVTYVPFRNAHFLSVAVSWAEVIGANAVFIGAVAEDSSGYPDCRPEYYRAFQQLVREGTRPETQIEIVTPVIRMRKWEIVKRGVELGAPLDRTWSCYQFEDAACGVCDSCRLRLNAFTEAGISDPIVYRVPVG
jgi:7-cyano-7-deazaguanine synthase